MTAPQSGMLKKENSSLMKAGNTLLRLLRAGKNLIDCFRSE